MNEYDVDDEDLKDEDEFSDLEAAYTESTQNTIASQREHAFTASPRKRLELLMEERRLRDELEDFLDI